MLFPINVRYKFFLIILSNFIINCSINPFDENYEYGIISYFKFDNDSKDQSIYKIHGKEFGNPEFRQGVFAEAISFDGLDDYIETWSTAELNKYFNTMQGTISLWIKPNLSKEGYVFYYDSDNNDRLFLGVAKDNWGWKFKYGFGDYYTFSFIEINVDGSQWYHVVFTWKGRYFLHYNCYINGNLDRSDCDTDNWGFDFNGEGKFLIGKSNNNKFFKGLVDEMLIYDRDLETKEILNLYNGNN